MVDFDTRIHISRVKAAAIRRVLDSPEGRVLMVYITEEYGHDTVETNDTNEAFRALGRRDVYLDLRNIRDNTDEDYTDVPE